MAPLLPAAETSRHEKLPREIPRLWDLPECSRRGRALLGVPSQSLHTLRGPPAAGEPHGPQRPRAGLPCAVFAPGLPTGPLEPSLGATQQTEGLSALPPSLPPSAGVRPEASSLHFVLSPLSFADISL